jgi:hypothetical protein
MMEHLPVYLQAGTVGGAAQEDARGFSVLERPLLLPPERYARAKANFMGTVR